jgi:hypothetical protein
MAKDPSFLFYSKDWLQGTAGLMPDEKGVYIDLLAHQHQDGDLPNDVKRLARMTGLSQVDFDAIWSNLKAKFILKPDNRLVNRKLLEITTERLTKGHTNKILSQFGVLIRSMKKYPEWVKSEIKKDFNISDFQSFKTDEAIERLTKWFTERLTNALENGNANTGVDESEGKKDEGYGGMGEREEGRKGVALTDRMLSVWKGVFPMYTADKDRDTGPLREIATFIFKDAGFKLGHTTSDDDEKALNTFQLISDQVNRETFWVNKPLATISKHIQEFYNKIKNPVNGSGKLPRKTEQRFDDEKLKAAAAKRFV